MKEGKGFALIEMLVVMVIMGILAYFMINKGSLRAVKSDQGTIDPVEKAQEAADKFDKNIEDRMKQIQELPE